MLEPLGPLASDRGFDSDISNLQKIRMSDFSIDNGYSEFDSSK